MHVVVVGAGAAGLSASWLLSQNHKVTMVELEPRLGGHAHSAFLSERSMVSGITEVSEISEHRPAHTVHRSAEQASEQAPEQTTEQSAEPSVKHRAETETTDESKAGRSDENTLALDTGFIVYNELNYPNLVAWFDAMNVATEASDMSFAVSRDNGGFEYAGGPRFGLLAQPSLLMRPRYWRMLKDLLRFYRQAPVQIPTNSAQSLGDYLSEHRYSRAFIDDHLMPFGAAVWSTSRNNMLDYPAAAFIRFCENHGLLKLSGRPQWRTVTGGSHHYVQAARKRIQENGGTIVSAAGATDIKRDEQGVTITLSNAKTLSADQVVIATHADTALSLLNNPDEREKELLGVFQYDQNHAVLHRDASLMPRRKQAWCSWNYVEQDNDDKARVSVSYWMNRLQNLSTNEDYFVSLNPSVAPAADTIVRSSRYGHPIFNAHTWAAQQELWSLQGVNRTWFCGAYFGAGFHEDAVQAGFAVAEHLGGTDRPWNLDNPSDRIVVSGTRVRRPIAA